MESRKGRGAELKSACSGSIAAAGRNEHRRCVPAQEEPVGVDGFIVTAGRKHFHAGALPVGWSPAASGRSDVQRRKVPVEL